MPINTEVVKIGNRTFVVDALCISQLISFLQQNAVQPTNQRTMEENTNTDGRQLITE